MTSALVAGAVGLALLTGLVGADEPTVEPRGTFKVCVDGTNQPGGFGVWAEGPSGRSDQLESGRCATWRVKPGGYRVGLVVDPESVPPYSRGAGCTGLRPTWTLTRPGMLREGADPRLLTTNVAAEQVTELRWMMVDDCEWKRAYYGPLPEGDWPEPDPRRVPIAAESSRLDTAGAQAGPTGTLEVCEQADILPYDDAPFYLTADGPSARSALVDGEACHSFTVPEGRYEVEMQPDPVFREIMCSGERDREVRYVPAGRTTRVELTHECATE